MNQDLINSAQVANHKPFSQSCENNKLPILEVIKPLFSNGKNILEIGSGTGQHAAYFAAQMPHLQWQTSDRLENITAINSWITGTENILAPIELDVLTTHWQLPSYDGVFTANTLHIMSWQAVEIFFNNIARYINEGGYLCVYGPFIHAGETIVPSNLRFNAWLKQRDPLSAIRAFDALNQLASDNQLHFVQRYAMPANNEILVWQK